MIMEQLLWIIQHAIGGSSYMFRVIVPEALVFCMISVRWNQLTSRKEYIVKPRKRLPNA